MVATAAMLVAARASPKSFVAFLPKLFVTAVIDATVIALLLLTYGT